jgi:asparagine synthase (glutamine-hydrolysing)
MAEAKSASYSRSGDMCGIAGILRLGEAAPPAIGEIEAMVGALEHRGPDEFGLYRDERASLGHARLSIIDLKTGQQPLANEDDTLWVVFNGEIFNYVELRAQLVAQGHRFRTNSDTEVIVHAYQAWKERAFAKFNGQFAIALWDARSQSLVLARDRLGVRPLYLCEHGGRLYFASEVKAIFAADATIPRVLDGVGLAETFTFWSVVPPQSVFAGITELEPGHVLTVTRESRAVCQFWQPRYPTPGTPGFRGTLDDAVHAVRSALDQAVSLRMLRSDVPVGSYLSGGLDSSLIAAMGRRAKGDAFATFSVRFEESEFDETRWQRMVAQRLASDHHEVVVRRADIAAAFPAVVLHAERPILRTAPVPLFLLSRLAREAGIKVVLTGEGADEVFAGYDLFREAKIRRFWGRQPASTWRPRLLERLYSYLHRSPVAQRSMAREFFGRGREQWREPGFGHQPRWRATAALQRLFNREIRAQAAGTDVVGRLVAGLPAAFADWPALCQDQYLEMRTLLSGYLLSSQGDRMLMANSVEGRFPFLDANVVDLADSLPPAYKLRVLDEKHVVKRAAEGLVPEEIISRPKQPYRAPDALSFAGPNEPDWIADVLSGRSIAQAGIFDASAVDKLWSKCRNGGRTQFSNSDNMALCGVLSTQLLHRQFVQSRPAVAHVREYKTWVDRLKLP